jgi:YaiO family outer membrane protein
MGRLIPVAILALLLTLGGAAAEAASVEHARKLAAAGQRREALEELERRLTESPTDSDARILYGTILSWEGRRDEARRELQRVLLVSPAHSDALVALGYVELWEGNFDEALALADRALPVSPARVDALLLRATALARQGRRSEAREVLDRIQQIDPTNETAAALRRSLRGVVSNSMSVGYDYSRFDDERRDWNEASVAFGHRWPKVSMIATARRAERFATNDQQIEVEAYPSLRRGTYAYLAAALGDERTLYPRWRLGGDLYQSLGRGFEASLGYRHLEFSTGTDIYIGALTRYVGNWMLTGRIYNVPASEGPSMSYHALARRYGGDGRSYVGARLSKGFSREEVRSLNDIEVLDSQGVAIETLIAGRAPVELTLRAGYSREERPFDRRIGQTTVSATVSYRY